MWGKIYIPISYIDESQFNFENKYKTIMIRNTDVALSFFVFALLKVRIIIIKKKITRYL